MNDGRAPCRPEKGPESDVGMCIMTRYGHEEFGRVLGFVVRWEIIELEEIERRQRY